MDTFLDFIKNFVDYIISINANGFYSLIYLISRNWLLLFSTASIAILIGTEIRVKTEDIIDDQRDIY